MQRYKNITHIWGTVRCERLRFNQQWLVHMSLLVMNVPGAGDVPGSLQTKVKEFDHRLCVYVNDEMFSLHIAYCTQDQFPLIIHHGNGSFITGLTLPGDGQFNSLTFLCLYIIKTQIKPCQSRYKVIVQEPRA